MDLRCGNAEAAFGSWCAVIDSSGAASDIAAVRVVGTLERLELGLLLADHAEETIDLSFLLSFELLMKLAKAWGAVMVRVGGGHRDG